MRLTAVNVPRSSIVRASVGHRRTSPREHAFTYPMVTLQLDVDELERGQLDSLLFAFNKKRLCSVRIEDYLCDVGSLRERVQRALEGQGLVESPLRITMVTMPRLLGYVFNPVTFFICFNQHQQVIACVTQVHNTFGEAHVYPLVCESQYLPVSWQFEKSFFVSPFFDSEGQYRVSIESEGLYLKIIVDLFKSGVQVFASSLEGRAIPLTRTNLLKTLAKYPLTLFWTMPRIHFQAVQLFMRAKVVPFLKPPPASPYTIRSQQNTIHKVRLWLVSKMRSVGLRYR